MAFNYTRSAATAKRLIEANGRTVSLIRKVATPGDTDKPWRGPTSDGDDEVGDVKAIVYPVNARDVDGNNIRRGDEICIIAHTSLASPEDLRDIVFIEDGGRRFKVMNSEVIGPGDVVIVYSFQLRQ